MLALITLLACDEGTDSNSSAIDVTGLSVTYYTDRAGNADRMEVELEGGSGAYRFGISESGCGTKCWTPENCVGDTYAGYGPFCHEVMGSAVATIDCAVTPKDVDDDHTLFCGVESSMLTYFIETADESWCAVAGADPDLYKAYGCHVL